MPRRLQYLSLSFASSGPNFLGYLIKEGYYKIVEAPRGFFTASENVTALLPISIIRPNIIRQISLISGLERFSQPRPVKYLIRWLHQGVLYNSSRVVNADTVLFTIQSTLVLTDTIMFRVVVAGVCDYIFIYHKA